MENSEIQLADAATPGQRLREARERAGISPREMADRLNWLPSYVTAIEEDRYESLRSPAFVRGYLRAYARALGLDADGLVDSFDSLTGGTEQEQHEIVSPISPASNQKTGLSVVIGIVIAIAVVGLIWWQSASEPARERALAEPSDAAPESSPVESTQAVTVRAADRDRAPVEAAAEPGASAAGETVPDSNTIAELAPAEPAEAERVEAERVALMDVDVGDSPGESPEDPSALDTEVRSVERTTDSQTATGGRDADASADAIAGDAAADADEDAAVLQFAFTGDCWLEVRDAAGALIYADLRSAGDTLALDGMPPFNILAGNAAAVSLRYRGEPFPVRARPGRAIARFNVGEP